MRKPLLWIIISSHTVYLPQNISDFHFPKVDVRWWSFHWKDHSLHVHACCTYGTCFSSSVKLYIILQSDRQTSNRSNYEHIMEGVFRCYFNKAKSLTWYTSSKCKTFCRKFHQLPQFFVHLYFLTFVNHLHFHVKVGMFCTVFQFLQVFTPVFTAYTSIDWPLSLASLPG